MIYRLYIGPRIPFNEMVNFICFFKFSRGGAGGRVGRENLKKKLKLTISLPQVPLGALVGHFILTYIHVRHIYMSNNIYMSDIDTCPTYMHVQHILRPMLKSKMIITLTWYYQFQHKKGYPMKFSMKILKMMVQE